MSSFWAANHGIALVLSYEEMDEIVENYCRKYPDSKLAEKNRRRKKILSYLKMTYLSLQTELCFL